MLRRDSVYILLGEMKEYQAVVYRLTQRTRSDEDALTNLLNERSRAGWELAERTQDDSRVVLVFARGGQVEE